MQERKLVTADQELVINGKHLIKQTLQCSPWFVSFTGVVKMVCSQKNKVPIDTFVTLAHCFIQKYHLYCRSNFWTNANDSVCTDNTTICEGPKTNAADLGYRLCPQNFSSEEQRCQGTGNFYIENLKYISIPAVSY